MRPAYCDTATCALSLGVTLDGADHGSFPLDSLLVLCFVPPASWCHILQHQTLILSLCFQRVQLQGAATLATIPCFLLHPGIPILHPQKSKSSRVTCLDNEEAVSALSGTCQNIATRVACRSQCTSRRLGYHAAAPQVLQDFSVEPEHEKQAFVVVISDANFRPMSCQRLPLCCLPLPCSTTGGGLG